MSRLDDRLTRELERIAVRPIQATRSNAWITGEPEDTSFGACRLLDSLSWCSPARPADSCSSRTRSASPRTGSATCLRSGTG